MKRVSLGDTGLHVSSLCFGSDSIGSKIPPQESFELLDFYYEVGGNFIDTANIYAAFFEGFHGGESETTIGEWLKQRGLRSQIILCSKLGQEFPGFARGLSAPDIQKECEASLRRLQTDYLDVYYAHVDDPDIPIGETMQAFHNLINAGKVRKIAASNMPVWRIAQANLISEINGYEPYSIIQQRYTYLRPHNGADFRHQIAMNDDLRDFARRSRVSLVGYSVLLQGAYTRKDRPLPPQYAGDDSEARMKALKEVAAETGITANQVIIAWMLQSDPKVVPIIAGSRTSQLQENIDALGVLLSDEQMKKLNTAGNPEA
jgi:aryl-alcohol dehydrogenase-like predicted oxidoreductase